MLEIEKGVPYPKHCPTKLDSVYPLAQMEVGDSFVVQDQLQYKRAVQYALRWSRKETNGQKRFSGRIEPDRKRYRVWRIA